jgi:signal recognition particle subunit SRP68
LEETRKKQTESFEEITWLGDSIPIRNVKLRGAIVSIKDIKLELGVQDSVDKKISLYDKLFSVFSEAQKAAKDEQTALEVCTINSKWLQFVLLLTGCCILALICVVQTQQKSQKSDLLKKQLQQVNDYINYERLSSMSDRNMMLAEALEKKIDDLGFDYALKQTADESRQISGFYETLMQLLTESDNLLPRDAETNKQFEAKMFSFKALRCLYLSLQYVQAARWSEASALFERSLEHSDHALSLHGDCKNPDKNLLKKVERLQKQIQGWTCYLKARVFMDTKASPKAAGTCHF